MCCLSLSPQVLYNVFESFVTLGADNVTGVDCLKGIGMYQAGLTEPTLRLQSGSPIAPPQLRLLGVSAAMGPAAHVGKDVSVYSLNTFPSHSTSQTQLDEGPGESWVFFWAGTGTANLSLPGEGQMDSV